MTLEQRNYLDDLDLARLIELYGDAREYGRIGDYSLIPNTYLSTLEIKDYIVDNFDR